MTRSATAWFGFDSTLPADSVECCPGPVVESDAVEGDVQERVYMVCGTYQLEQQQQQQQMSEAPQQRKGMLHFLTIDKKTTRDGKRKLKEEKLHTVTYRKGLAMEAILDMKWAPDHTIPTLAVACAESTVHLLHVDPLQQEELVKSTCIQWTPETTPSSVLCLALDWSSMSDQLAVSLSSGELGVAQATPNGWLVESRWQAHAMEAWTVAWDPMDRNVLVSGADDALLKLWDRRHEKPLMITTGHNMGVTALQFHPNRPHLFASGSYDEQLRLWDRRFLKQPLTAVETGGGIWRIRWHPMDPTKLAVAAMHNGCHVFQCDLKEATEKEAIEKEKEEEEKKKTEKEEEKETTWSLEEIVSFQQHQSLAYGLDWLCFRDGFDVASCSFYDHQLYLWSAKV